MPSITVRHVVPISNRIGEDTRIVFSQWLPVRDAASFVVHDQAVPVRVWFDLGWTGDFHEVTLDDVARMTNPGLTKVGLDANGGEVPEDLVQFIYQERNRYRTPGPPPDTVDYVRLARAYADLGHLVHSAVTTVLSRLLHYVRINRGQFWIDQALAQRMDLQSFIAHSHAQVRSASFDWITWHPPIAREPIRLDAGDPNRRIQEAHWPELVASVSTDHRFEVVLEILANADELATRGHYRAAVVEGVAAFEIAVERFVQRAGEVPVPVAGLDAAGAARLRSKLGLRGFVDLVLPHLVPAVAHAALRSCRDAIEVRNEVSHGARRRFEPDEIQGLLAVVRRGCQELADALPNKGLNLTG